jgi:hypothetical protein
MRILLIIKYVIIISYICMVDTYGHSIRTALVFVGLGPPYNNALPLFEDKLLSYFGIYKLNMINRL